MKTTLFKSLFAAFAVLSLLALSPMLRALESGQAAPAFTLADIAGKTHSLADFKGKIVVLEWVNPECPFVKHHYQTSGNIPGLQKAAKSEGVVWLSINSGRAGAQGDFNPEQVTQWMKETGAAPAAYFRDQDGKVGKLYGAKTTPHIYVISAEGLLVYQGAIDEARGFDAAATKAAPNYASAAIKALREGKTVTVSNKPPYGCGVKY